MALKPKKEMTDAQKANLKKMLSKGGNLDKDAKARAAAKAKAKPSTSYSPAPMSAAAKKAAKAAGKESMKASIKRNTDKMGGIGPMSRSVEKPKKASTAYSPKPLDTRAAAVKRSEAKRKELTSNVVKAVSKTAKYTPMGAVAQGAVKVGRALGKVIPKK